MAELLNRPALKAQARELLRTAQVPARAMTALYSALVFLLKLLAYLVTAPESVSLFADILTNLAVLVLGAGFTLYCMGIRRGERVEYTQILDGFSFSGKIILLNLVQYALIGLWSMLFAIPGIIAFYRYRFALYNLYENPDLSIFEALERSKRQTRGYKMQLFNLDVSYLGWTMLGMLPALAADAYVFASVAGDLAAYAAAPTPLVQVLLCNLWSLAVTLFYLPNYQCVLLDYFDSAKSVQPGASAQDSAGAGF